MFDILIPTRPKPADRPRSRLLDSGKIHVYIPDATRLYEEEVSAAALSAGVRRIEGPVAAGLEFGLHPPSKHEREGDVDNLSKSILDGLKGAGQFRKMQIAYKDDRQVHILFAMKRFLDKLSGQYARARLFDLSKDRKLFAAYLRAVADEIEEGSV